MNNKNLLLLAAGAALAIGLIALPSHSTTQEPVQAAPPAPGVSARPEAELAPETPDVEREFRIVTPFDDDGGSWLGVETREVTAENVKEFKLPGERGVVIGKVLEDSPGKSRAERQRRHHRNQRAARRGRGTVPQNGS